MFGIGGGELIFILFIILMLFGSDKVPEMARTMGKAMAQLKNATNDIKSEIQKGAEANGFDPKALNNFKQSITSGFDETKKDILGDSKTANAEIKEFSSSLFDDTSSEITKVVEDIEDGLGAIKRKK